MEEIHLDNDEQNKILLTELRNISNRYEIKRHVQNKDDVTTHDVAADDEQNKKQKQSKSVVIATKEQFLLNCSEDGQFNQYWYSVDTISTLCSAILEAISSLPKSQKRRIAFLSTPSLYYSMPNKSHSENNICVKLFDYDRQWENDDGFIFYDFNHPTEFQCKCMDNSDVNDQLQSTFDMVVIDPPFITTDVWEKYAITAKYLLKQKTTGLILATTVIENSSLLKELFGNEITASSRFEPSIPNLVYQYTVFTNFVGSQFL